MNQDSTNGLLLLIIAILLFGSGAVLGFFSTIFWIIVAIVVIIGLIWFVVSLPKIGKNIVQDEVNTVKKSYQKHPTYTIILWTIIIIFFSWLIITWISESNNKNGTNAQSQSQYIPTTQPEGVKQGKFNLEKAKAAGLSDEYIQRYLTEHPGVYVYPKANRDAFLTSCYKESDNNISGCTCLLNYLQARYTIDEYTQIESDYIKSQQSEPLSNAVKYCAEQ